MSEQINILKEMFLATKKCISIAEDLKCVEDIQSTLIFDNLISNLVLIKEYSKKLSNNTKLKFNFINWYKFDIYTKEIDNDLHSLDYKMIYKIIKEELPILHLKLTKILESN
jgi:uncharacterized protein with HEPN domain